MGFFFLKRNMKKGKKLFPRVFFKKKKEFFFKRKKKFSTRKTIFSKRFFIKFKFIKKKFEIKAAAHNCLPTKAIKRRGL